MSLTIFFSSKIIVNLLKGFKIEEALPFALGLNLFIVNDFPTYASLTIRLSISNCLLFSNEKEISLLQHSIQTKVDILCSNGAKGCRINEIQVDAKEISVVNTNGAGDALVGVFLSYYNLISQQEALNKAVNYATEVCLIGGPRIQKRH